jgi:hypothetical protein
MSQEATWNTHGDNFLSSLRYCNINIPFMCSVIDYLRYLMAIRVTMKFHPPQLPFQMWSRGRDFATVSGDSFLSEVNNNNIKKIKETVFDAGKNTGLILEVNAQYTKYTFMVRHYITRQSCDKSVRRDHYVFDNMAKLSIWRQQVTISFANKLRAFYNSIKSLWLPVCYVRNYRLK